MSRDSTVRVHSHSCRGGIARAVGGSAADVSCCIITRAVLGLLACSAPWHRGLLWLPSAPSKLRPPRRGAPRLEPARATSVGVSALPPGGKRRCRCNVMGSDVGGGGGGDSAWGPPLTAGARSGRRMFGWPCEHEAGERRVLRVLEIGNTRGNSCVACLVPHGRREGALRARGAKRRISRGFGPVERSAE